MSKYTIPVPDTWLIEFALASVLLKPFSNLPSSGLKVMVFMTHCRSMPYVLKLGTQSFSQVHLHLQMRPRHSSRIVWKRRPLRWNHNVPWDRRSPAKGTGCPVALEHEGQDHCTTRAQVFRMDWRFHLGFPEYIPESLGFQAGV